MTDSNVPTGSSILGLATPIQVELSFTPGIVRRATLAYLRRGLGLGGAVGLLAVVGAAALLVALRPGSWLSGVATGAALVLALLVVGLYLLHYRRGIAKLRRTGSRPVQLELSDTELRVTSEGGSLATPWSTFEELWQFPDLWLLILGRGQFMTLPLAGLSREARELLAKRVPTGGRSAT
ncbi:MAG: YcxB family protein [Holophagales bacterium]|nr:MAG: YcxB family protein [Holophagales bacterium]